MNNKPRLVVLDDDAVIAGLIGEMAQHEGFSVEVTTDRGTFERALDTIPDVIVLDPRLRGHEDHAVLRLLAERRIPSGLVLVSSGEEPMLVGAERFGASQGLSMVGALAKPFVPDELSELLAFALLSTRVLTPRDLQRALQNDELEVRYEPVLGPGAASLRVTSMEALLRWQHPVRGDLGPEDFLHLCDHAELDRAVAEFVVARALQPLEGWRDAGIEVGLRLDLTTGALGDDDFPERLEALCADHGLAASVLTLEVGEHAFVTRSRAILDLLTALRVKRFGLALDDFGVGQSPVTALFDVPFTELKIDPSLMRRATSSPDARLCVESLVALAKALGIGVCAQGIDHEEGLSFATRLGCDALQGRQISAALPASRVPAFVRGWENRVLSREAG